MKKLFLVASVFASSLVYSSQQGIVRQGTQIKAVFVSDRSPVSEHDIPGLLEKLGSFIMDRKERFGSFYGGSVEYAELIVLNSETGSVRFFNKNNEQIGSSLNLK